MSLNRDFSREDSMLELLGEQVTSEAVSATASTQLKLRQTFDKLYQEKSPKVFAGCKLLEFTMSLGRKSWHLMKMSILYNYYYNY